MDWHKQMLREMFSQMQHWRLMKMIEHTKEFFNSWRAS